MLPRPLPGLFPAFQAHPRRCRAPFVRREPIAPNKWYTPNLRCWFCRGGLLLPNGVVHDRVPICRPLFRLPPPPELPTNPIACFPPPLGFLRLRTAQNNEPDPCPVNHECPAGTALPLPCSALKGNAGNADTCHLTGLFYVVMAALAIVVVAVGVVGVRRLRRRPGTRYGTSRTESIPFADRDDGPVYGGY